MSFVLGGEHPLDNDLVGAPVPDAQDGRAKENSCPGKFRIARWFDHVEIVRRQSGAETCESSDLMQTDEGKDDGADDQNDGLNQIGIDDRR